MSLLSSLSAFTISHGNPEQAHGVSQIQKPQPYGGFLEKRLPYSANSASGLEHCSSTTEPELPASLRTPHSGYHFDGSTRKFFEGWYFKVSIPEKKKNFCFIYSVENPAFKKKLGPSELARYGPRCTGVGVQILGVDDKYFYHFSQESHHFWGCRHDLAVGNTFVPRNDTHPPNKEVPPEDFNEMVLEGFQASASCNQGYIRNRCRPNELETAKSVRWEYYTLPKYGWGRVGAKQKAAEGWTGAVSVFEPHYQICMARGISTGWIEWDGERYEFQNAHSYVEKNWGEIQCNIFEGVEDVALTAAGGLKKVPGLGEYWQNVALIGIHHGENFYEFGPSNGVFSWEVDPWGFWFFSAENKTHQVELKATAEMPGTMLLAPVAEGDMAPVCRNTCHVTLRLQLWERNNGGRGKVILDCVSDMAAAEVGGAWPTTWKGESSMPWLIRAALRLPLERFSILIPSLKPPGL